MEILFFLSALISEIMGTMAGFGSSTIFLPFAVLFFDFKTALVLVAFAHIFGNLSRIGFFRHGLDKKLFLRFSIPSAGFAFIGAALVNYIPQNILKLALGIFLVIYSLIFLWKKNIAFPANTSSAILGGGLSGFIAGLIGTGGALRGAFLISFNLTKERYIAMGAATALLVDITRVPVYLSQGFFGRQYLFYLPFLLAIAIVGSYIGMNIVNKMSQTFFHTLVLIGLLLIGLKFIFDFIG